MTAAWLALGGNVGDSRAILDRAIALLCDDPAVRLIARSSDYRTPPWGFKYQPQFTNLCIAVETSLTPAALLGRTQAIERQLGRNRTLEKRNGPRTADIDILAYNDLTVDAPNLKLPHPRMFERAFVLAPLAEIAPDQRIGGIRIADALERVDLTGIEKLPAR